MEFSVISAAKCHKNKPRVFTKRTHGACCSRQAENFEKICTDCEIICIFGGFCVAFCCDYGIIVLSYTLWEDRL